MRYLTLHEWLAWQETLHPSPIDMGLQRVSEVWQAMACEAFQSPIVSIAGTNGKGSCTAMLQAIYLAAGYSVASYTSPHLWRYNERITLNGDAVEDERIVQAFADVDEARGDTSLTYFEFGTLAALSIFAQAQVDVILLEVGLGGRLDAVNIIDADVALITSIDLDHQSWLGSTREAIAREKAGILRPQACAVLAEDSIPQVIDDMARQIGTDVYRVNESYRYEVVGGQWQWSTQTQTRQALPLPALSGPQQIQNAAAVLMVTDCLASRVPVHQQAVREGLLAARLRGRFEIWQQQPVPIILDVAHNAAAVRQLAATVSEYFQHRSGMSSPVAVVHAVFSILADKDLTAAIEPLIPWVHTWHLACLQTERARPLDELSRAFVQAGVVFRTYDSILQARMGAQQQAGAGDAILVYGSFHTVAEAVAETGLGTV